MGSTAIQILTEAFRAQNLNDVTSFATTQEFPFKVAKDIINDVIRVMNRAGNYWFTETKTALAYGVGIYSYSLTSLEIDPKRIFRIRREASNYWGNLIEKEWPGFQDLYRSAAIQTAKPEYWSKFSNTLELNSAPDQDYSLFVYHYKEMPLIANTTDTFLVPERDEDILIEGCYQLLGYRIGRWTYQEAVANFQVRIRPLLASLKKDAGIAHQMPASF